MTLRLRKKLCHIKDFTLKIELSHNISPGEICPIIVSSKHFSKSADNYDRTIIPALWGIVPRWHKGEYKKHGLTTNNARIETIRSSKLYKPCLTEGQRCILPVEGFYEWQTVKEELKSSERPVYFIYMPQENNVKIEDKNTWPSNSSVNLMYIAGIFDIWHDENKDYIYSFSIITYESNEYLSWLHHRTPAILETEDQVSKWLNYEDFPYEEVLTSVIKHPKNLVWHPVSKIVNNSRNKSEQCNKPEKKPRSIQDMFKRKLEADKDKIDEKKMKK